MDVHKLSSTRSKLAFVKITGSYNLYKNFINYKPRTSFIQRVFKKLRMEKTLVGEILVAKFVLQLLDVVKFEVTRFESD